MKTKNRILWEKSGDGVKGQALDWVLFEAFAFKLRPKIWERITWEKRISDHGKSMGERYKEEIYG